MRKDIKIHINSGDIAFKQSYPKNPYEFRWVDDNLPNGYLYGEIVVPENLQLNEVVDKPIYFKLQYTPIFKPLKLRLTRKRMDDTFETLPQFGTVDNWYLVKDAGKNGDENAVCVSQMPLISDEYFCVTIKDRIASLFSGVTEDFKIIEATHQNKNCLLACHPGNHYRYPLTGVGLSKWLNAPSSELHSLTTALQKEFTEDGVAIESAEYDFDIQQLEMTISEFVD